MITEDYVSFETAKLLKGKGFDEDIDLWYDENGEMFIHPKYDIGRNWRVRQGLEIYQCSTLQMAMKWLREVHGIDIDITSYWKMSPEYANNGYRFKTHSIGDPNGETSGSFDTYEKAAESAIKYCLTNLI